MTRNKALIRLLLNGVPHPDEDDGCVPEPPLATTERGCYPPPPLRDEHPCFPDPPTPRPTPRRRARFP